MTTMATRVLLVEDDAADAYIFRRHLRTNSYHEFELEHVDQLADGLEQLSHGEFEVLVLDLGLPDSLGIETFSRAHHEAPDVPIIVLSGDDDEALALQAVREGAQDYLVKGEVTAALLARAIHYAIERHHLQQELRSLSLTDELTGLHNRRGFQTLAEQQVKQARRACTDLSLVYVDIDGLKEINDTLGHQIGDRVLVEAACLLRRSFRDTDIVARIGGDEFTVFLVDARGDGPPVPLARLEHNLRQANEAADRDYPLSMSFGLAVRDTNGGCGLTELIAEADRAMYQDKRGKKRSGAG